MLDTALGLLLIAEAVLFAGVVGAVTGFVCWLLRAWLLNLPALVCEALHPRLHYRSRVLIVGGFYATHFGTLKERNGVNYLVDVEDGIGQQNIAICHVRPLVREVVAVPKYEERACHRLLLVQEMGDE